MRPAPCSFAFVLGFPLPGKSLFWEGSRGEGDTAAGTSEVLHRGGREAFPWQSAARVWQTLGLDGEFSLQTPLALFEPFPPPRGLTAMGHPGEVQGCCGCPSVPRGPGQASLHGAQLRLWPQTRAEQLLPRATFLPQIISTSHRNFCHLRAEFSKTLGGAASIFGCSAKGGPFLKEEVLGAPPGFCWDGQMAAGFQTCEPPEFLLVGLTEPLGELGGGSFSKFTFMKYE